MPMDEREREQVNARAQAADWDTQGYCPDCPAKDREPCVDKRYRPLPAGPVLRGTPHSRRRKIAPSVVVRTGWRKEMHQEIIDLAVKNGTPVTPQSIYGVYAFINPEWQAIRAEVAEVGIDYSRTKMPEDTYWYEPYSGGCNCCDEKTTGIEVKVVLNNRKVHTFRSTVSVAEFLSGLVEE